MKAIYTNKALNETYTLAGVNDLGHAWNLVEYVCSRFGWNFIDVFVTVKN